MRLRSYLVILFALILVLSTSTFAQQSIRVSTQCNLKPLSEQHKSFLPPPSQYWHGEKTSEFELTFVNATQEQEEVVRYAADIWSKVLVSDVPIKVLVTFYPIPSLLGQCISNMIKDFPGAPVENMWYVSSLSDALTGVDQQPGEYDMDIFITTSVNWYEDLDGNCPATKYDLASTVIHEMGHGLGYFGLGYVQNGIGSYGHVPESALIRPIIFDFPNLEGLTTNYDGYVVNSSSENSTDTTLFPNPSEELGDLFRSQDLFFHGEFAVAANDGAPVKLYAPRTFYFGSSLLHLDELIYPAGNINSMMTPSSGYGEANHNPGPITIGIFQDLGWTINDSVTVDVNNEDVIPSEFILAQNYPNPFNPETTIDYRLAKPEHVTIKVYDILGNEIATLVNEQKAAGSYNVKFNASNLSSGIYIYKLSAGPFMQHRKMLLMK